jgi:peptidoglycan/LPS O-acetylase OafA/YrhL
LNINALSRHSGASVVLDLTRFVAAIMVVLFHMGFDFVPGYQAVMIFFVLSGYLIAGSVLNSMLSGMWSWRDYLVNRLTRLYVVLIPSLIFSPLLILLSIYLFGGQPKYANSFGLISLVKNLLFLQFLDGDVFAYNLPLWSLANEFWYYLLFPFAAGVFYYKTFVGRLVCFSIAVLLGVFTENIFKYFLIWCLGLIPLLVPLHTSQKAKIWNMALSSCLFVVAINSMYFIYRTNHLNNFSFQYAIDLTTALAFSYWGHSVISFLNDYSVKKILVDWSVKLSGFSYSIYILHYPILSLLYDSKRAIVPDGRLYSMCFTMVAFFVIVAYCYFVSIFTEAKTGVIKNYIFQRLNRNPCVLSAARSV